MEPCTHRLVDEELPVWRCSHPQVHSRLQVVWSGVCAGCMRIDGGVRTVEPRELVSLPSSGDPAQRSRGLGDTVAKLLARWGIKQRPGCGCAARQEKLNRWFPYRRRRASLAPRDTALEPPSSEAQLLLRFPHGFGDAVQLTTVLLHLRELRPRWTIDVACKRGADSLFAGLCRQTLRLDAMPPLEATYAFDRTLPWDEPDQTYHDSPSTKAEKCLREVFALAPVERLCRYQITPSDVARQAVDRYLRELCGRVEARAPIVLLHYQGNSARGGKNLDEQMVRKLVAVVRGRGLAPVVLDWETPPRSSLVREGLVACPGAEDRLWQGLGTGDGGVLAALIARATAMVAIDSGPGHVAAATSTPTLVVWRRHHPVNYFGLDDGQVTHVVTRDHGRYIRGDRATGEDYLRRRYRALVADAPYRVFLPRLLEEQLRQLV
ncbi:MAG: hypothetical protein KF708_02505 [Pirellulales bacterium]|nr:hypothetical protein [Pirellulales bacterium]